MATARSKIFIATMIALSFNFQASADPTKAEKEAAAIVAAAKADKDAKAEKDAKAALSKALFPMIEETQDAMNKALGSVRSDLAADLESKTKQLLADPEVYAALVNMAYQRKKMESEPREDEAYAAEALSSLNGSLRLSPGVMSDDAILTRATLLSQIAGYYSSKQPPMCRYIPSDFSILMNIDAPWLVNVDAEVFHQAIDDEYRAIKLMLTGVLPRHVNDSDKQMAISKFAGHWLSSLDEESRYRIAAAKQAGNYCELWSGMLKDMVKMADNFPDTKRKVVGPFLVSMTRGWMDSGLWSYEVRDEQSQQ